jgi:hypothetical protein
MYLKTCGAALAAAILLTGCGGGNAGTKADTRKDVAKVVAQLGAAARDGDAGTICTGLLTRNLQTSIRRAAGTSCAQEVAHNVFGPKTRFQVEKLDVGHGQAVALVKDQDGRRSSLVLLPESGAWKTARIGSVADVKTLGN